MKKTDNEFFYRLSIIDEIEDDHNDSENFEYYADCENQEELVKCISNWLESEKPDIEENTYILDDESVDIDLSRFEQYFYIMKHINDLIRIDKIYYYMNKKCFSDYYEIYTKDEEGGYYEPFVFASVEDAKKYIAENCLDEDYEIVHK
ncbi:hypothetical protein [[Mycoplasma] gypis]|uniref:hypothetical protein n=1 Tax=[Mycoplasma] gypis TaxID=92404 RepID=UPI0019682729|nr:hypothetical protein [[Mycoplasma] gypis]MBN0919686.1 hypothetical protein [[Mycoplasma] gypis]